jgi:epoxyqueuosine reductase
MLDWDEPRFRKEFRGTPIFRLKRNRWLRNICTVLGNIGTENDLPSLEKATQDQDPLVREHAQWGKNQIMQRLSIKKD